MRFLLALVAALAAYAADLNFDIPPVRTNLEIEDQAVAVSVSGHAAARGETVGVDLEADLADLQAKILAILRAELNQDNRCGDRLAIGQASLAPDGAAALLTANVHYEKWACARAFGKEIVKRLVGGDGQVRVRLTAVVETPGAVRLRAEVLPIEADGQLGEILRSGQFGAALREKIRRSLEADLQKSANLQATLPPAVREIATIRGARFRDGGNGRLMLAVAGEVRVTAEQAEALAGQLKRR